MGVEEFDPSYSAHINRSVNGLFAHVTYTIEEMLKRYPQQRSRFEALQDHVLQHMFAYVEGVMQADAWDTLLQRERSDRILKFMMGTLGASLGILAVGYGAQQLFDSNILLVPSMLAQPAIFAVGYASYKIRNYFAERGQDLPFKDQVAIWKHDGLESFAAV